MICQSVTKNLVKAPKPMADAEDRIMSHLISIYTYVSYCLSYIFLNIFLHYKLLQFPHYIIHFIYIFFSINHTFVYPIRIYVSKSLDYFLLGFFL